MASRDYSTSVSSAEVYGTVRIGLMACMNEVRTSISTDYVVFRFQFIHYLAVRCWWLQVADFV